MFYSIRITLPTLSPAGVCPSTARNVRPLAFPLFLSLSNASLVPHTPDFPLLAILRSSRPAGSRYYPIAISLARPAFFGKPSRSRPYGAIAQMLTRPGAPADGDQPGTAIRAARYVRTYICYICNRKLCPADEINRSRRLLRNAGIWLPFCRRVRRCRPAHAVVVVVAVVASVLGRDYDVAGNAIVTGNSARREERSIGINCHRR